MIQQNNSQIKVVIVGDSSVGKTAILNRFAQSSFTQNYLPTIGVDFKFRRLKIQDANVKYQIWDTAGQERYKTITTSYYRGSKGILIVFDLSDQTTFKNIKDYWIYEVNRNKKQNTVVALVGAKLDLKNLNHKKIKIEIQQFYKENRIMYFECSSKDDIGIIEIFKQIYLNQPQIIEKKKQRQQKASIMIHNTNSQLKKKKSCCQ